MNIHDIDTPCAVVDLDVFERNLERMAALCRRNNVDHRPHVKSHKIPDLARMQLAAGAVGVCVATLWEAEVMAGAGIDDIFMAREVVDARGAARAALLNQRCRFSVAVDSWEGAQALAAAASPESPLRVLVEVNTGSHRCGLLPDKAAALCRRIAELPSLALAGIFTHGGASYKVTAQDEMDVVSAREADDMLRVRDILKADGIELEVLSVGSTPSADICSRPDGITELRTGSYAFNDMMQVAMGLVGLDDCALTVHATVFSKPVPTRVAVDAGSKCLGSDQGRQICATTGFGWVREVGLPITGVYEEHGMIVADDPVALAIGDRVSIVPNHGCIITNLIGKLYGVRGDRVVAAWNVPARGYSA